jgi:hypothetical protein
LYLSPAHRECYLKTHIYFGAHHENSKATRTLENIKGGSVELTAEDKEEVAKALTEFEVKGHRYRDGVPPAAMGLWA